MKKVPYTKAALIFSLCLMILWALLGTGATIAWFTSSPETARNSFQVGILDLKVSYKNDVVTEYTPMTPDTGVFNDRALYEPGYTQAVYLKIENAAQVAFDYKLSVTMNSYTNSTAMDGEELHLPDYLRFGVIFGATEEELTRTLAQANALQDMEVYCLDTYSQMDTVTVEAGQTRYAALVVYMPQEVDNAANYRGDVVPAVELGVVVYAQQAGTPMP